MNNYGLQQKYENILEAKSSGVISVITKIIISFLIGGKKFINEELLYNNEV